MHEREWIHPQQFLFGVAGYLLGCAVDVYEMLVVMDINCRGGHVRNSAELALTFGQRALRLLASRDIHRVALDKRVFSLADQSNILKRPQFAAISTLHTHVQNRKRQYFDQSLND